MLKEKDFINTQLLINILISDISSLSKKQNSYSSEQFLNQLVKTLNFPIHCLQTDNSQKFTKRLAYSQKPAQTLNEYFW